MSKFVAPPLEEVLAGMHVVAIPTRTRFRGITTREAVIFEGGQRWSEFSPFPEYADSEAAVWLRAALEFGWSELPPLNRDRIEVNATVPAVEPSEVAAILDRFAGCTTVKVKVAEAGQTIAEDVARVRAVREHLGDTALIRIDANGGWFVAEAEVAIRKLAEFNLDYVEQPCPDLQDLVELKERMGGAVKIAADESVRKAEDPLAVARAGAADLIVVKAQPLGGIHRALDIIEQAGLPVVISSALDTSVGISMGAHLAAALPPETLYGACGLGTAALLAGDVTEQPLLPEHGSIPVEPVTVSQELLRQYRAPEDRAQWWRDRVERCYALLTEGATDRNLAC